MKKKHKSKSAGKDPKEIVVENFCEPIPGPQKDECVDYYEEWEKTGEDDKNPSGE